MHKNNLVYHVKCAEKSCNDDYVGQMARRIFERVLDHNERDKNSLILENKIVNEYPRPQYQYLIP